MGCPAAVTRGMMSETPGVRLTQPAESPSAGGVGQTVQARLFRSIRDHLVGLQTEPRKYSLANCAGPGTLSCRGPPLASLLQGLNRVGIDVHVDRSAPEVALAGPNHRKVLQYRLPADSREFFPQFFLRLSESNPAASLPPWRKFKLVRYRVVRSAAQDGLRFDAEGERNSEDEASAHDRRTGMEPSILGG